LPGTGSAICSIGAAKKPRQSRGFVIRAGCSGQ
jgi:hypothetical protein